MDNAVVWGWGTVGKATAKAFSISRYFSKSEANITLKDASNKRYHFICLPTPTINGECFRDDIIELIRQMENIPHSQNVYIIRSTVIPGTARYIQEKFGIKSVISNPEFLSEKTSVDDAIHPDIVVIGGDKKNYVEDVQGIYAGHIKTARIITTDTITAELIKYTINSFYAMKVVFANEIFDLSQKIGANYETVKEAVYARKWMTKNHFNVWDKGGRGAGGKCLKKDIDAFENYSKSKLLATIKSINEELLSKYPKKEEK